MAKKRVFVSFDFDHDKISKDFIAAQAHLPDSPFEVIDASVRVAVPMKAWEEKTRAAIKRSDFVIVMVGAETYKATGVIKEVQIAREVEIPIVQVIGFKGHKDRDYLAVPNAGPLGVWNWEKLKKLVG